MKRYCLFFVVLGFLAVVTGCEGGGSRNLTREDSLAICKAMVKPDSLPRKLFASGKNAMVDPQDVKMMRLFHQDYMKPGNSLPLYSSDDPRSLVRYFNVPKTDIDVIQKAMGSEFGGFRIYLGFDEAKGFYHLILVGVNSRTGANHVVDREIFNDFKPCPNVCLTADDPTDLINGPTH